MEQQVAGLRVAVVGYGMAGRLIHSPLIDQAGHRVAHVVTGDPGRRAEAAADRPGVRLHEDLAALLAADDDLPDLVVLATPTGHHVEHALAVIGAGLPVVLDKPLALDEAGARQVVEAAERAGVPLTVFHNRRWDDEQRALVALLATGVLGEVHRFERRWERWRPEPRARWRELAVGSGGGLLLDLGSHLVDAAMQLFGPVASVYAELRSLTTPAEDDVFLALAHTGGTTSHLWAGSLAGAAGPRTRVLGSAGAFLVPTFDPEVTAFEELRPPIGAAGWLVRGEERHAVPQQPGEPADFYRSVGPWLAGAAAAPVDPWDAVRTATVLDAARLSAATRQVVTLT